MIPVDPYRFPGPALWQAIMIVVTPAVVWGMVYKDGRYLWRSVFLFVVIGAGLMWWIIRGA